MLARIHNELGGRLFSTAHTTDAGCRMLWETVAEDVLGKALACPSAESDSVLAVA